MSTRRQGPRLTLAASCCACVHENSADYAAQGDSGFDVYCTHPEAPDGIGGRIGDTTWATPPWCPLLAAAKAEFAASLAPHDGAM